jgi:hypothetical protein
MAGREQWPLQALEQQSVWTVCFKNGSDDRHQLRGLVVGSPGVMDVAVQGKLLQAPAKVVGNNS